MNHKKRPLSPHLQVYKPQLTSVMSIMHRGSGVFLSFGTVIFVYWLYRVATAEGIADQMILFFQGMIGQILLYLWVFAFAYHLCNGIRHLFWDTGKGFEISTVYKSGYFTLFAAVVLTATIYLINH